MNITDVKELLQAGFTASEIREMLADKKEKAPAEPAAAPEVKKEKAPAEPAAAPEVKKEKAPAAAPEKSVEPEKKDSAKELSDAVSAAIAKSFKPFEEIYNKLATLAGMPSIADVQPKGIEDIITNFFKED